MLSTTNEISLLTFKSGHITILKWILFQHQNLLFKGDTISLSPYLPVKISKCGLKMGVRLPWYPLISLFNFYIQLHAINPSLNMRRLKFSRQFQLIIADWKHFKRKFNSSNWKSLCIVLKVFSFNNAKSKIVLLTQITA